MIPQDKIIQFKREAGFFVNTKLRDVDPRFQNFANLVAQYQKEQDALICEDWDSDYADPRDIAAAIRSQE